MNLKAIFQIKSIRLIDGLDVKNECKEMKVSRIVSGFLACPTRLMPFSDLKNIWIVEGITFSFRHAMFEKASKKSVLWKYKFGSY